MDTAGNYTRLARDCLKMAKKAQDPETREEMTRLAQLWARLADQAKRAAAQAADHGRAA